MSKPLKNSQRPILPHPRSSEACWLRPRAKSTITLFSPENKKTKNYTVMDMLSLGTGPCIPWSWNGQSSGLLEPLFPKGNVSLSWRPQGTIIVTNELFFSFLLHHRLERNCCFIVCIILISFSSKSNKSQPLIFAYNTPKPIDSHYLIWSPYCNPVKCRKQTLFFPFYK